MRRTDRTCPRTRRSVRWIEAPYLDQSGRYPTGCECVTAVMLLRHLGLEMEVDEFIRRYVPVAAFERRGEEQWGPDPREVFCGSPYDEDGMGCYAPVICRALTAALADAGLGRRYEAVDETGAPMRALLERYVDRGMPVVFWACIDMRPPVAGPRWRLLGSGETFEWASNEHCMLLVGYDEEGHYFNDPHGDHGCVCYPRELTEQRHAAQHGMAVGIREKAR